MPIDSAKYPKLASHELAVYSASESTDNDDNSDVPSATQEKPIHKANLFRKLGVLVGDIYKDEKQLAQNGPMPLIRVYTLTHEGNTIKSAEVPQSTLSASGETLSVPFDLSAAWITLPEFQTTNTTWLIGYDIETQSYNDGGYYPEPDKLVNSKTPHCVSHQWYFNFQGIRFGFIFLTTLRITQADFVSFIDGVVPDIKDPDILKTIKVYAHYSVYESGWMIPSPPKAKAGVKTAKDLFSNLINENNDEWYGFTTLRECEFKPTKTKTGKPSKAKAKEHVINLEFGDSQKLQAGSLETLGKTIGIPKIKLPDGAIEQMADFLITNPLTFCEYAIIDSVITAETHLYFFHKYKTCMQHPTAKEQMRMPGYSSQFFRELYKSRYDKTWKKYLGYVGNDMTLIHKAFVHFYHGGRNDVLTVGPQGEAHYLDLHSAYLTSVVMLPDYNFGKVRITTGSAAEQRLDELYMDGPFQVVGIECSFRFNDKGKPIFPVRIDEAESLPGVRINFNSDGIIYPKSGKSNLTMPEFWVARHNGLLDKIIVHRVIEFEKLPSRWLSGEILKLLI
ncbi:MAG TPA: hypothetical protein HPP76_07360, partial [Desulfuromonadales bacterium]|nr:hypothetical protein [Desulfuromonadales bacterium]